MNEPRLHFWFELGKWWCGSRNRLGFSWGGRTPIAASRARWDWLHAKDEARP